MTEEMQKRMEEYEKKEEVRKQKEEELKEQIKDLSEPQKKLFIYRKIIETGRVEDNSKGFRIFTYDQDMGMEDAISIGNAAHLGWIKPLLIYTMRNYELDFQEAYSESLIRYNNILENYKKLAQELKVDSSLDLSHLFAYMLWNGYFSVSKEHSYKLQERLFVPGMYSFDVIKGKGVCLAYANLLSDYLTKCEKESSVLYCKVPSEKGAIRCDYRPEIERNVKNSLSSRVKSQMLTIFLKGVINKVGNHAVTLIRENGNVYIYDPTNLCALNIKDSSTASIVNGKGEFALRPLSSITLSPLSDYYHIYEDLFSDDIKQALTRKDFIVSFENLMEIIKDNISLLDDAYDNIHSDLEYIDKETDKIGGGIKAIKKYKKNKKGNIEL